MTNSYYNSSTPFTANTSGRAAQGNNEFLSVAAGFDAVAADIGELTGSLATSSTSWTPATGSVTFTLEDARTLAAGGYRVRRAGDSQTFAIVDLAAAISASTTFTVTARKINDNTLTGPYTDWVIESVGGIRIMPVVAITANTTVAVGHLGSILAITGASALTMTLTAIATLGEGFWCVVQNNSTALQTIARGGTNTIGPDSATSLILAPRESALLSGGPSGNWRVLRHRRHHAKGADIASAATTDLSTATGDYVDVTGTTTITGLGTAEAGVEITVQFDGALTLTHNATSLVLPGAANITTAAGDHARFRSEGSGNWRCVAYTRAASGPLSFASQATTAAGTSTSEAVTPNGLLAARHADVYAET